MIIASVTVTDSRESEIADALKSVVDHVDRMVIVDTGVKDGTIERARDIAGDKLVVVESLWADDFSAIRNASLDAARALGVDWILIVDTDERIRFNGINLREALKHTRSDVLHTDSTDGHYPKDRVVRASAAARFVGFTHEVLIGGTRDRLHGVTFDELQKSDEQAKRKFTRDVVLLKRYILDHADDPRWWYYLGQSFEGLDQKQDAAEAFGECFKRRGGAGEEAAWAAYKQAVQLYNLERYDQAIAAAARGLGADSTFTECAWFAAVCCARLQRKSQATAWARMAEATGYYKRPAVRRAYFRHLPALYELPYDVLRFSLSDDTERAEAEAEFVKAKLARVGAKDDRDLDALSIRRDVFNRYEARCMLRPLPLVASCPSAQNTQILFEPPNGWHPMNPSICWHDGDIWCVIRTINYTLSGRNYTIHDKDGIVRTENYLGILTPDIRLGDAAAMRDLDPSPRQKSRIVGYEDVRLVSVAGEFGPVLCASATVCDRAPDRRLIARLDLNDDGDVTHAEVQPTNQLHEKNWMPLSVDGEFTYIYSLDPTAILPGPLSPCPFALEHLRGGAAIPFKGGYLCVVHETIEADEGRIYLHRFVKLDVGFNVTAVSPAWVFAHHGIEFCAGLIEDDGQLVLSYGLGDKEAWITTVKISEVEAMRWHTIPQEKS